MSGVPWCASAALLGLVAGCTIQQAPDCPACPEPARELPARGFVVQSDGTYKYQIPGHVFAHCSKWAHEERKTSSAYDKILPSKLREWCYWRFIDGDCIDDRECSTLYGSDEPNRAGLVAGRTTQAPKPACTDKTKAELAAHFKSKGWVHWQFACVGDSLHASYLAGLPGFNEAVLRGDIEYLQDFYSGEIYVTRHYDGRSLGVCGFANGEIYCDGTED